MCVLPTNHGTTLSGHFLCSCGKNRVKQGEGSAPVGDCARAKDGEAAPTAESPHTPALRMESLSELSALQSEPQGYGGGVCFLS